MRSTSHGDRAAAPSPAPTPYLGKGSRRQILVSYPSFLVDRAATKEEEVGEKRGVAAFLDDDTIFFMLPSHLQAKQGQCSQYVPVAD